MEEKAQERCRAEQVANSRDCAGRKARVDECQRKCYSQQEEKRDLKGSWHPKAFYGSVFCLSYLSTFNFQSFYSYSTFVPMLLSSSFFFFFFCFFFFFFFFFFLFFPHTFVFLLFSHPLTPSPVNDNVLEDSA